MSVDDLENLIVPTGDDDDPISITTAPSDRNPSEEPPAQPAEVSIVQMLKQMSWRQRLTLLTAAFINFTSACCFSIMAPFLPLEAEAKGIDSTTVGIIFSSFQLTMFFGSIIFGRFLTALGARFLFIGGNLIAATCAVLFGILEWCPPGAIFAIMAILCRLVEATGCSMAQTASVAIVANEFKERVATVIGILESVSGLGFMLGPTIGGALYDLGGFFLPFAVLGFVLFICGVTASFTLPKTAIVAPKDRNKLLLEFMKLPAVVVCGILILICATMMSFLDPILSNQLAEIDPNLVKSQTLIGLIFLVMPALYALLNPVVGYLADTFKHQWPLLAMGNLGLGLSFILMGPCPLIPFLPSKQLWLIIVALVVMGFCCSFCFMPAFAIISKSCEQASLPSDLDLYGIIAGFFGFAFNLGAFAGPLLGGLFVQHLGFAWATSAMSLAAIVDLVAMLSYALISCKWSTSQISVPVND